MMEPVEPYIKRALNSIGRSPKMPIFRPLSNGPQLSHHTINQIIIYRGSFNPPHIGHLTLLQHVLEHRQHGLNLVAAMVYPCSDEYLRRKTSDSGEDFLISQGDRCRLWKEDGRFPDNGFTFEGSKKDLEAFSSSLIFQAERSGLEIKVIMLAGAEYLTEEISIPEDDEPFRDLIFTDFSRSNILLPSSRRPVKICGYSHWVLVANERRRPDMPLMGRVSNQAFGKAYAPTAVWRCYSEGEPPRQIYFLARDRSSELENEEEIASSTQVRRALREKAGSELQETLKSMTLSPLTLRQLIISGGVEMEPEQRQRITENFLQQGDLPGEERRENEDTGKEKGAKEREG